MAGYVITYSAFTEAATVTAASIYDYGKDLVTWH